MLYLKLGTAFILEMKKQRRNDPLEEMRY